MEPEFQRLALDTDSYLISQSLLMAASQSWYFVEASFIEQASHVTLSLFSSLVVSSYLEETP